MSLLPVCHFIWFPSFWFHQLLFLFVCESKWLSALSLSISRDTWIILIFSRKKKKRRKRKTWWLSSSVYIHFKCLDMFITFKILVGKNMWNYPKHYFNDILQLLFHFYEGVFPCITLLCSTVLLPCGCQAGVPAPCRCLQLGVKEESGHLLHHICTTCDQPSQGPKCAPMERKNTSGKTAWNCPWGINFH